MNTNENIMMTNENITEEPKDELMKNKVKFALQ